MSIHHRIFCRSAKWKRKLNAELMPWLVGDAALGNRVLEIGAGAGSGTQNLLGHAEVVVALERDSWYLRLLHGQMKHPGLIVIGGDAAKMPFRSETFSSVVAIMVLHHIWPLEAQQRVIAEAFRVLRPGGVFIGLDARPEAFGSRIVHYGDRILPVDRSLMSANCADAGFERLHMDDRGRKFRFCATRPIECYDEVGF
jgi:ubiquinone/menaquinone biosynthesis C-methylase UbiE